MEFVSSPSETMEKQDTISLAQNGRTSELRAVLLANPDELCQTDWAGCFLTTNPEMYVLHVPPNILHTESFLIIR